MDIRFYVGIIVRPGSRDPLKGMLEFPSRALG